MNSQVELPAAFVKPFPFRGRREERLVKLFFSTKPTGNQARTAGQASQRVRCE